jgi:hypothetical protein
MIKRLMKMENNGARIRNGARSLSSKKKSRISRLINGLLIVYPLYGDRI